MIYTRENEYSTMRYQHSCALLVEDIYIKINTTIKCNLLNRKQSIVHRYK